MKCLLSSGGKTLLLFSFLLYFGYLSCQVVVVCVRNLTIPERHCLLEQCLQAEVLLAGPGLAATETFPFSSCLRDVHWGTLPWEHAGRVRS